MKGGSTKYIAWEEFFCPAAAIMALRRPRGPTPAAAAAGPETPAAKPRHWAPAGRTPTLALAARCATDRLPASNATRAQLESALLPGSRPLVPWLAASPWGCGVGAERARYPPLKASPQRQDEAPSAAAAAPGREPVAAAALKVRKSGGGGGACGAHSSVRRGRKPARPNAGAVTGDRHRVVPAAAALTQRTATALASAA